LGFKPELVDGLLWDETTWGNGINLTTNYSLGIDLGAPKEITRIRFYLNIRDGYHITGGGVAGYIYKSDDNVIWELCHTIKGFYSDIQIQDNSWEFVFECFFPVNQTARYFKLWCSAPVYIRATESVFNIPTCSEIKVFSEIPNSYKTGIGFSGDSDSYILVPARQ
jgi:hypothetical protein